MLLYLERNKSISFTKSGKLTVNKDNKADQPSSRNSSPIGSLNSSKNSRTSTPKSADSFEDYSDGFSKELRGLLFHLIENKQKKLLTSNKYFKQENKLIFNLQKLVGNERNSHKPVFEFPEHPEVRKKSEIIAKNEKLCEKYAKENKAMKTLLAEMTLSQVDAKIQNSHLKQGKSDIQSVSSFIEKYSKVDSFEENLFLDLFCIEKDYTNYCRMIEAKASS